MFIFGPGTLWGTRTDAAGVNTPINFGNVQEVAFEDSFTIKELYGQYQSPIDIARGSRKITAKAKLARIQATAYANLFYGKAFAAGTVGTANNEAGTIPATPFQIVVANSATWVDDLGVYYKATGLPLARVAAAPTVGQYAVTAGTYLFALADVGALVYISYTYTIAGTGRKILVTNDLMGTTPTFQMQFSETYKGVAFNIKFYACVSGKLALPMKLEDYGIAEMDINCYGDAAGNVYDINFGENS